MKLIIRRPKVGKPSFSPGSITPPGRRKFSPDDASGTGDASVHKIKEAKPRGWYRRPLYFVNQLLFFQDPVKLSLW
jgi:hypothetical protein